MPDSLVKVESAPQFTIVRLALPPNPDVMELDQVARQLRELLETPGVACVFDLTGTGFAGSSVLGFLVNARGRVKRVGGRLILCHLSPHLMESFRASSLGVLFEVVPTLADASALFA
jgi:anti-anti-sigma factor